MSERDETQSQSRRPVTEAKNHNGSSSRAFIAGRLQGKGRFVANPDDPPVHRPPQGTRGPLPEPYFLGQQGRAAIVQGQMIAIAFIVIAQLWIVTDALFESLSGRTGRLWWLALASLIGFVAAIVVWRWPRNRIVK
ncbi:MAG TPA: hypothetical protein VKB76_10240 [Ktedonobacterales bacterium]|nr:hypothetical protein [Ktedonobacterales bacterium]